MEKEKILGFNVITQNEETLINNIFNDYLNNEKLFIVNINPTIVVENYDNSKIKDIFNNQKYQIPDGSGIVWASKKNKGNVKARITGIDLVLSICQEAQKYNAKVYLYGGKEGIAEKAKEELINQYPKINIVGTSNGYGKEEDVLKNIKETNPDIVFVGLGSPKQEEFIINHINELESVKLFMPVGGSFDVISKFKKRAPAWMIKCNLEWLYRLFQEPKRFLRQLKLIKFVFLVLKNKERKDKNE